MGYGASWNKCYASFAVALLDCGQQLKKQGETVAIKACEDWLKETHNAWMSGREPEDRKYADVFQSGKAAFTQGYFRGDEMHPWFTGALHDSISTQIYDKGRTIAVRFMERSATETPQFVTMKQGLGREYEKIVGSTFGRLMAGRSSRVAKSGVTAVMQIGVPYAQYVNEGRHEGYIDELQTYFEAALYDAFNRNDGFFKNLLVKPRK